MTSSPAPSGVDAWGAEQPGALGGGAGVPFRARGAGRPLGHTKPRAKPSGQPPSFPEQPLGAGTWRSSELLRVSCNRTVEAISQKGPGDEVMGLLASATLLCPLPEPLGALKPGTPAQHTGR